jgi:hypothetical protein
MTLFELVFGLSAVILGLALTQVATNFHRLVLAGRRVRWAPEPLLLCAIIFLIIISVWLTQWGTRSETHTTIGMVLLQVLKILMPYLAAAFVLPDRVAEEGPIDLYRHYDHTRAFTYGFLIAGLLLFFAHAMILRAGDPSPAPLSWTDMLLDGPWIYIAVYTALIFIRVRWFNVAVLTAVLVFYAWQIIPLPLGT